MKRKTLTKSDLINHLDLLMAHEVPNGISDRHFRDAFKATLRIKGMTPRDFALLYHISVPTATRWYMGTNLPHIFMRSSVVRDLKILLQRSDLP